MKISFNETEHDKLVKEIMSRPSKGPKKKVKPLPRKKVVIFDSSHYEIIQSKINNQKLI